jgi:hypothetical protein
MKIEVNFSEEFKGVVKKRVEELISAGQKEGTLNDSFYGDLKIFIEDKPSSVLFSAEVNGHQVYVGGEQE